MESHFFSDVQYNIRSVVYLNDFHVYITPVKKR